MLFAFCLLLGILSFSECDDSAVSKEVSKAAVSFSLDLFKEILKENDGNVVASPVSVATLLALVQQGASGNTLSELTKVLHVNQEQSKQGYSQLTRNLRETNGNLTLEFANAAYLNKGYTLRPTFKDVLENNFHATTKVIDLSNGAAAAADINSWVQKNTHDKIQNLVSPDSFNSLTRLVLLNAIYFKDFWKTAFNKENTRNDNFYTSVNTPKKVSTMHLTTNLLTGDLEQLDSRWLQLPFQGGRFYLLVILPNQRDGLSKLSETISDQDLANLIENIENAGRTQRVELSLPSFKLQSKLNLVPTLRNIGLTDIFGNADLRGISEEPVAVSDVIQKAEIQVDEKGATAAAATGVIITGFSAMVSPDPVPIIFKVDHPFHAYIVDDANKIPLFASRITDPSS